MKHGTKITFLIFAGIFLYGCMGLLHTHHSGKINYPHAPRSDQVDDYHGTLVADPFRPLEDLDSPDTKQWVNEQNVLTESYLKQIPYREKIRSRLTELWNHPRASLPFKRAGRYFQ